MATFIHSTDYLHTFLIEKFSTFHNSHDSWSFNVSSDTKWKCICTSIHERSFYGNFVLIIKHDLIEIVMNVDYGIKSFCFDTENSLHNIIINNNNWRKYKEKMQLNNCMLASILPFMRNVMSRARSVCKSKRGNKYVRVCLNENKKEQYTPLISVDWVDCYNSIFLCHFKLKESLNLCT